MIRFQIPALAVILACCATAHPLPPPVDAKAGYVYANTVDLGEVSPMSMAFTYGAFRTLAEAGVKTITLRIDSFGGSVFLGNKVGRQLEDLKKQHGIAVTCIVDGSAYSMGAVFLESPLCDLRLATARSTILFHNGSGGAEGTAEDMRQSVELLEALNAAMALQISGRLGVSPEEYRERIAHKNWVMASPAAQADNVIDGIVSPLDIAPPAEG